jgi:hypothetical protein
LSHYFFFSSGFSSHAHKEWVHQYIAQEVYYYLEACYLKYYCGDISDLKLIKDAIIDPRTDSVFYGKIDDRTNLPWLTNFGIAIREWREDVDDLLYDYSLLMGNSFCLTFLGCR